MAKISDLFEMLTDECPACGVGGATRVSTGTRHGALADCWFEYRHPGGGVCVVELDEVPRG